MRCDRGRLGLLRGRRFTGTVRPFEAGPHQGCIFVILQSRPPRPEEVQAGFHALECFDLGPLSELTPREFEVLRLIGQGLTQREVALRLDRTVKTVEAHRAALGRKLGAKKNVHLVQVAFAAGMLDPAEARRPVLPMVNGVERNGTRQFGLRRGGAVPKNMPWNNGAA